ncbi:uncharacterized protein BP5553_04687 [Venustampulla echinocandica]|uniref:Uncharacterized protein n=1 Tax=Venustampulla echinocandica TaxID=2656787 RepID=A0A370TP02_9HELO|nr:uncharacterized protein BP5553_04687 [Venustampulla echinocandica]RDL37254.1 hypothetical protein BP5553_04687 [Venustampulla echinocandica]
MSSFAALSTTAVDKLVDKHFDKVPDKYLYKETYDPRKLGQNRRKRSSSTSSSNSEHMADGGSRMIRMQDNESRGDVRSMDYDDGPGYQDSNHYSQGQARDQDQRYPKTAYPYYAGPTPPTAQRSFDDHHDPYDDARGRQRYPLGGELELYNDRQPSGLVRRRSFSSSPHRRYRSPEGRPHSSHRHADGTRHRHRSRHRPRDAFTTSKAGYAGGALAAVAAGWATHTALQAHGKSTGKDKNIDRVLTVVGAAVGGLAGNSLVDYLEDGNKDTRDDQERWEDKFGHGRRRDRSESRGRDRGRRRSYDDDRDYR